MFDDPLSLQGVHSSNFHSKMQKITVLACPLAKNSTASQKNCTDVFALSARVYNFAHDYWSTDDINDENEGTEIFVIALFVSKKCCFETPSVAVHMPFPVNVSLSQVAKDKAPVTHDAPTLPAGLPCLLWPRVPPPSWHRRPYLPFLSLSTLQRCSLFCQLDTRLPATCLPDLHPPGVLPNEA